MAETTAPHGRQDLHDAVEEISQTGSWEWTPAESDLLWSDNLFRIYGLAPGEIVPTPEYVRAHAPRRPGGIVREVAELQVSGQLRTLNYPFIRPDGSVRHLRATLAVTEWRGREPYRLVGLRQDETDRWRAEREIGAQVAVAEALTDWDGLDSGARRLLANVAEAMNCISGGLLAAPQGRARRPRDVARQVGGVRRAGGDDRPNVPSRRRGAAGPVMGAPGARRHAARRRRRDRSAREGRRPRGDP